MKIKFDRIIKLNIGNLEISACRNIDDTKYVDIEWIVSDYFEHYMNIRTTKDNIEEFLEGRINENKI